MAQVSLRLDDEIYKGLERASKKLHLRRSDIIRIALADFLKNADIVAGKDEAPIYERLKPFLGVTNSGISDLSSNPKHLADRIKKGARR
jgi:hypothetical protein